MRWKITLTHAIEGSVIASEPEGLVSAIIGLSRHPDFHTLVKEFKSAFRAYGSNGTQDGRRDWIKNIESVYGPDAVIDVMVEYAPDDYVFQTLYSGEIGIQTIVEGLEFDHYLEFTPVQTGFWRKFISRYDVPVNIQSPTNLDGEAVTVHTPENLRLPSQVIVKTTSYNGHSGDVETLADCDCASTVNVTLSGLQTIDSFVGIAGSTVLLKNQTDQKENGKWDQSSGVWTRSIDANAGVELAGAIVKIKYGGQAGTVWKQQTDPVTIGVSNIVWLAYNYVSDVVIKDNGNFGFLPGQTANIDKKEIVSSFTLPFISPLNLTDVPDVLEIDTDLGNIIVTFNLDMVMSLLLSFTIPQDGQIDWTIELYAQKNRETAVLIDTYTETQLVALTMDVHLPDISFNLSGTTNFDLLSGDTVRTYISFVASEVGFAGGTVDLNRVFGGITDGLTTFEFHSLFEDTQVEAFLQHDVAASILDRITTNDKFYSELFGSPYTQARSYVDSGSWWNNLLIKLIHSRGYTLSEKLFSLSMKEFWEGANPMFNLSLGYETIGSEERIVIRTKAEAYDSTSMSVLLSGVQRIKKKLGPDYFNSCDVGYINGKTEDSKGIDDPQKESRASILKNIGRKLTLFTTWIGQSLTFEQARRTTRTKSTDYKFDDNIGIIEGTRIAANEYTPRLNEDFISVTNLLNEETRYNKHHTPARIFLRWLDYLSGGLQKYLGTDFVFTGGEGNYDMVSTMIPGSAPDDYSGDPLAEKANITVGTTYLWVPKIFEIEHYLTFEEFKTIDDNRNKAIGISQSYEDHEPFFIDDLQFEIMSGQIKIIGKFKNEFDIVTVPPGGQIFQGGKIFDATFGYEFE